LDRVYVGGNSSLTGLDATGTDVWWTSSGDSITALACADIDGDGRVEVLHGGADCDLRAYRGSDVVFEVTETDGVSALAPLGPGCFAYALVNGTLGVYSVATALAAAAAGGGMGALLPGVGIAPMRAWRVKAKGKCVATVGFDFDGDGVDEVVALWASGKVEVRRAGSGEDRKSVV
jgi:Bardet-Biedl syndrome 2 protein